MAETNIEDLIKDMGGNNLSPEENSMVNSILNDLNGEENPAAPKITSQQQMPQITDEEKELLIKQQMAQQKIAQERMQQQMAQQAQLQAEQQQRMKIEQEKVLTENNGDMFRMILTQYKDVIIVLFLSILFNLETISESMKFKTVSFLYDMESGKESFLSILLKGIVIASVYLVLKLIIK